MVITDSSKRDITNIKQRELFHNKANHNTLTGQKEKGKPNVSL